MPDRFQTVDLPPISQGMITMLNSPTLDDRAAKRLLNMEYALDDMPQARKGMTCWCEHSVATHPFNKRISSLAYFKNNNTPANGVLLATTGTEVYRSDTAIDNKAYTSIKGALTIDDDVEWMWREFNWSTNSPQGYIMIGLPDQSTVVTAVTNMVKWTGTGNLTELQGAIDFKALAIEEINRRMFYINRDDPTQLIWSQLGNPLASKTTTQILASGNGYAYLQKEMIGLGKTRDRLFAFMRDSIYQVIFGEPETDQNLFSIRLLTPDGGCINRQDIVPVLDDIWFLSDVGWVSLNAVQKFGDFEQALIGDKLFELKNIPRRGAAGELKCPRAINYQEKNQVWIAIPSSDRAEAQRRYNEKCYVMSYRPDVFGIAATDKKFSEFSGRAPFTAATIATYQNRRRLFVAKEVKMDIPTGVGAALSTGGSNPNGTYYFRVVAVDQYGDETSPSAEVTATVVNATDDRIVISWTAHPNATNIRIYKGSTHNGQDRYKQTTGGATSFNWDSDAGATLKALPTVNLGRIHNIFLTDDKDVLEDDLTKFSGTAVSEIITSEVETKDYTFGNEAIRKEGDWWSSLYKMLANTLTMVYSYMFDFNPNLTKTKSADFSLSTDAKWDEAIWDSSEWSMGASPFKKIERKFVAHPGRIFNAIRFKFRNTKGERWGFRGLSMDIAGIDEKESTDA